jgi:hypothetical protein
MKKRKIMNVEQQKKRSRNKIKIILLSKPCRNVGEQIYSSTKYFSSVVYEAQNQFIPLNY